MNKTQLWTPTVGDELWVGDRRMTITHAQPGFYVAKCKDAYYYALGFNGGHRHLDEPAAIKEAEEAISKAAK